jgi:IS5 family transposase
LLVITHQEGLALDVRTIHGNPYNGHTLEEAIKKAQNNNGNSSLIRNLFFALL